VIKGVEVYLEHRFYSVSYLPSISWDINIVIFCEINCVDLSEVIDLTTLKKLSNLRLTQQKKASPCITPGGSENNKQQDKFLYGGRLTAYG
jgi:hypothetical protein